MGVDTLGHAAVEGVTVISAFNEEMLAGTVAETLMLIPGVSNTLMTVTLPDSGRILGIGWNLNAALTGGTLFLRPALGTAAIPVGPQVAIVPASGTAGFNNLATTERFAAGEVVGVLYETAALLPVNVRHLIVTLCVVFDRSKLPG